MSKFSEVKIGQTFYTSNGRPSKKISDSQSESLCVEYVGFDFQQSIERVIHTHKPFDRVYGILDSE